MRYSRFRRALLCALALGLALLPGRALAEEEAREAAQTSARGEILVVYPDEADHRTGEDNLSALARTLLSLRHTADFVEAGVAAKVIGDYDYVVWCATEVSDRMDTSMLKNYSGSLLALGSAKGLERFSIHTARGQSGEQIGVARYAFVGEAEYSASQPLMNPGSARGSYAQGSLTVRGVELPLASGRSGVRYLPLVDYTTPFAQAVLTQELAQWLWPYKSQPHIYTEYVVLDAVYPFADPYRLRDIVDYVVDKKMPFVISVMPIYDHAEYPAMKRFCEVLRYAQANGGAVILHAPVVQNGLDATELAAHLSTATRNYLDNGVWPLALEAPSAWLFEPTLRSLLGRYRTLFLSDLDAFASHSPGEYNLDGYINLGSQQVVPALKLDETGISRLSCCATAVYLNFSALPNETMIATIDAAKDAPIPMQGLWDIEQIAYFDSGVVTWDGSTLKVDGVQRFNVYAPEEDAEEETEAFDYKRNVYYRFVADLANQNRFLIAVSAVVLALFLILGLRSRRQMHKRFLKKKPERAGEGDGNVGG